MSDDVARAGEILRDAIAIDGLGGAVVHPTPFVAEGTYEGAVVKYGWTAMNATLVSEPSYTPSWDQALEAVYENLLYFEMSPGVRHVEKLSDILEAKQNGQLGVIFGLQSPSCIEQDRTRIRILYKLGLRILQLTYMERNFLGDGCLEPENKGLTHYGIQVIRECNRLGILVDCSHVGVRSSIEAAEHSSQPIVISHSAIRKITDNPRCMTDEQIKAVAERGGLVGITAYAPFIRTDRRPTLEDYLDHLEYAINLVGPDHVGIATDMFDGKTKVNWATPWFYPEVTRGSSFGALGVEGFNQKSELVSVVAGLVRRGYSDEVIKNILGGNWLRVLGQVWRQ